MSANRQLLVNNTGTVDSGSSSVNNPSEVVDEQIAIFDADDYTKGTLNLTGANATDRMQIVQGDDDFPLVSQIIHKDRVKKVTRKDFQAYVNQVTHVGYNGTDGDIAIPSEGGDATIKFTRLEKGFEQFPRASVSQNLDGDEVPFDVAVEYQSLIEGLENTKSFVRAEVLTDQSSSQLQDDDASPANVTLDVTQDSRKVTATVTNGASVDASAGDFLRIGHATDDDFPVYEIDSLEAASGTEQVINLVNEFQGETATGQAAGKLDAAPDGSDKAGLEVTAKDVSELQSKDFEISLAAVSFHTATSGIGDTEVRISTTPQTASGTTEQMEELERDTNANRSFLYRNYFPQTPKSFIDESKDYDLITILYENNNDNAVVKNNKYTEIILAFDTGSNIADQIADFFGV